MVRIKSSKTGDSHLSPWHHLTKQNKQTIAGFSASFLMPKRWQNAEFGWVADTCNSFTRQS